MSRHYYPALRGRFGDWAYYSLLMTVEQLCERVKFAEEIHNIRGSKVLSSLIQRELTSRAPEIAKYLKDNKDRFFNSLVVAVYGGSPDWHEFNIKPSENIDSDTLDVTAKYSMGYLSFDNEEHLFALDGQHRLAGLRAALKKAPNFGEEELSVIMISHHNTDDGLRRTRKLFTTLNKTAVPVNKRGIIALDETHVAAIVTRKLVEEHSLFSKNELIDIEGTNANLSPNDQRHITNIINVYDVMNVLFKHVKFNGSEKKYQEFCRLRPSDEALEMYYVLATDFLETLGDAFPSFGSCIKSKAPSKVIKNHRNDKGGHILFRPAGLKIIAEIVGRLAKEADIKSTINDISHIPVKLSEPPYVHVLWRTNGTMRVGGAALSRDLLLYILGQYPKSKEKKLIERYAKVLEKDRSSVSLPKKL